jgi:predicted ester cyclase
MYRGAFPDLEMTVDGILAEADMVALRWTATGTHRGDLMGIPPTGKRVSVTGQVMSRFVGGKVVEDREVFDALGMMQQLGAIPVPGQAEP